MHRKRTRCSEFLFCCCDIYYCLNLVFKYSVFFKKRRNMASSPLIEIVKRQALATFSKLPTGVTSSFEENMSKLKSVMNKITSADVNIDSDLLQPVPSGLEELHAPVTYIGVLDDHDLTIGIFVLRKGARLPLHDHPLMYGILKVVHGTVHIQSYSVLTDSERNEEKGDDVGSDTGIKTMLHPKDIGLTRETLYRQVGLVVRKEPAIIVSESDNVCVLSPVADNLHEIHSVNGPAAFIDVLSPPYDSDIPGVGPRPCRYFKELSDVTFENDPDKRPLKRLIRIPSPPDYWSRSAPYQGP